MLYSVRQKHIHLNHLELETRKAGLIDDSRYSQEEENFF